MLKKLELEISDYGRNSKAFGLVSAYGGMKKDYYDNLQFYAGIKNTLAKMDNAASKNIRNLTMTNWNT